MISIHLYSKISKITSNSFTLTMARKYFLILLVQLKHDKIFNSHCAKKKKEQEKEKSKSVYNFI